MSVSGRRVFRTGSALSGAGNLRESIAVEPAREGAHQFASAVEDETSFDRLPQRQIPAPPADQCSAIRAQTNVLRKPGVERAQRHLGTSEQKIVTARPTRVSELDPDDERLLGERVPTDPAMNVPEKEVCVQFARLQLAREPPLAPRTEVAHDSRKLETRGRQAILGSGARGSVTLDHAGVRELPEPCRQHRPRD